MGNLLVKIKRFISNKNTVTILCVLAGILVIYVGYNWRVSVATSPQSVPNANKTLVSGTVITQDDISYVEISKSVLDKTKNMITNANLIIGQAVAYGDTIQANSFFFEGDLKDPADNSYYPLASMSEDQEAQTLAVNIHTTFGNAIYPGNYIDLWFKGTDENRKLIYGELIESIKVLDVTDEDGRSVFVTGAESRGRDYVGEKLFTTSIGDYFGYEWLQNNKIDFNEIGTEAKQYKRFDDLQMQREFNFEVDYITYLMNALDERED